MIQDLSAASLIFAFLVIGFASTVKAAIGFGFPLIAVPLLSNIVGPRTAVLVMSVPVMLSNFMMIFACRGTRTQARRIGAVLGALVVGTIAGAQLLASLDMRALSMIVGVTAVVFVVLRVSHANIVIPPKHERPLSIVIGLLSGVLGGATNIYGPVLASYLHSLRMTKAEFVFAITLLFMLGNGTQVLSYWQLGLYSPSILVMSTLACAPMMFGILLGLRLQNRLSLRVWNGLVLTVIFLSGMNLLMRGAFGG